MKIQLQSYKLFSTFLYLLTSFQVRCQTCNCAMRKCCCGSHGHELSGKKQRGKNKNKKRTSITQSWFPPDVSFESNSSFRFKLNLESSIEFSASLTLQCIIESFLSWNPVVGMKFYWLSDQKSHLLSSNTNCHINQVFLLCVISFVFNILAYQY